MSANKWNTSLAVLDDMPAMYGFQPDVISYSTVISTCNKARRWELVHAVYEKMKAAGISGNIITYNALISAAGRQGQVERAFELWDEMMGMGLSPNVVTYSALIAACQHGDRWVMMACEMLSVKACWSHPVVTYTHTHTQTHKGG